MLSSSHLRIATTLLSGQRKSPPSDPISRGSWFMVSCGVGRGVAELRKPQVTRSIRVRRMIFGELAQSWLPPASFIRAPAKLILRRTTCHTTPTTRDSTCITELVARARWWVLWDATRAYCQFPFFFRRYFRGADQSCITKKERRSIIS